MNITSARGQAKVLGTLICIVGALSFTFWKGRCLINGFVHRPLINICGTSTDGSACELSHGKDNWIKGSALILTSHIAWSGWLILQVMNYLILRRKTTKNSNLCSAFFNLFIFGLLVLTFTGSGLKSLPSSIIFERVDLLLCIIAISFPRPIFCKESNSMEAGMERAAINHHLLCECLLTTMGYDSFEPQTLPSLHLFLLTFVIGSGDLGPSLLPANMVYQ